MTVRFHKGLVLSWYIKTPIQKYYRFWHEGGLVEWETKNCGEVTWSKNNEDGWLKCNKDCTIDHFSFMTIEGKPALTVCRTCYTIHRSKYDETKWAHYSHGSTNYYPYKLPEDNTPWLEGKLEHNHKRQQGKPEKKPNLCYRCVLGPAGGVTARVLWLGIGVVLGLGLCLSV
jgi:hypothetical protein